jgi:hypothetical protein
MRGRTLRKCTRGANAAGFAAAGGELLGGIGDGGGGAVAGGNAATVGASVAAAAGPRRATSDEVGAGSEEELDVPAPTGSVWMGMSRDDDVAVVGWQVWVSGTVAANGARSQGLMVRYMLESRPSDI